MKINLHFLPEKPYADCEVLVFHTYMGKELNYISNVHYCAKYGMFNCHEWSEIDDADYEYQNGLAAWAYMSDVQEGFDNEIQR